MRSLRALLVVLFVAPALSAATVTWTGTTNGNWSNASNWGGTLPAAGDDLVFPTSGANQTNTNDLPGTSSFNSISITGGTYFLSGNPFILGAGGITQSAGGSEVDLPLTLGAVQTWAMSSSATDTLFGSTVNLNGMALTLTGSTATDLFSFLGVISGNGSITLNTAQIDAQATNTTNAPLTLNNSDAAVSGTYNGAITANSNSLVAIVAGGTVAAVTLNGASGFFPGVGFPTDGAGTSGNVVMNSAASYVADLQTTTDFSSLNLNGTINLAGSQLVLNTGSTVFAPGTTFTIIKNNGGSPIGGTFAGLPEGATTVSIGSPNQLFSISYVGGSGHDVVLTAQAASTAVPALDGKALVLLAMALAAAGALLSRR